MNGQQRGIALISVLLVLSLALLITGGLLRSHHLSLQSSGQQLQQLQLRQLASGGETWALMLLRDALQDAKKPVERLQGWTDMAPDFEVDDGQIRIDIDDLAGRFNLNALLRQGQVDQVTLNRWARLLELLELPPLQLSQVGPLRELSQLRLLPGIDAHLLQRLEPWVALLPTDVALNINTAPALLLRTLGKVDAATANALALQATTTPWTSVQAFTQDPLLSGQGLSSHGLGTHSRWYRISVQVTRGGRALHLATDVGHDPETQQLSMLQRRFLPMSTHERPR
ncbi:type II secretion system protein GspK [Pseudomonas sp. P5_109]|uniref:type II secretion system protein GspK n=1 Tax=unclassified Pseudomonas TaxID=196821 RepID=UPI001CBC2A40|nr:MULTISPECIES: type II secretion system protein GspK [unclassified Pseudomonas]WPN30563.1 type II secretion system protein GspK [Pseudomonas sp. P5_109]